MAETAILFDFFGTLVEYQPDFTAITYPSTHSIARDLGYRPDHDQFVSDWNGAIAHLEAEANTTLREYSMADAAAAFLCHVGMEHSPDAPNHLGTAFVSEWQRHVVPVAGMQEMILRLSGTHRLAVVSNTHDQDMVPTMLRSLDIAPCFESVSLSVDLGVRKPHETIYRHALASIDVLAADAVFVGDSYLADFRGPRALGMTAYLIDPHAKQPVEPSARLATVLDVEGRLAASAR